MKINSKWIKDLNVRLGSIKLLEENIGKTLCDINHSNNFLDLSPRVMKRKRKKKMVPNSTQKLLHNKGNHKQNEKTIYRMGENICK